MRVGVGDGGQRSRAALHSASPGDSAPSPESRRALSGPGRSMFRGGAGSSGWQQALGGLVRPPRREGAAAVCAGRQPLTLPRFFPDPPNSISPRHRPDPEPDATILGPPGQLPPASGMRTALQGQSQPMRAGEANRAPLSLAPVTAEIRDHSCLCFRALPGRQPGLESHREVHKAFHTRLQLQETPTPHPFPEDKGAHPGPSTWLPSLLLTLPWGASGRPLQSPLRQRLCWGAS